MATAAQISSYFEGVLGRQPSATESAFWLAIQRDGYLDDRGLALALAASEEASGHPAEMVRLYEAAFGRKPDAAGFAQWTSALRAGAPLGDVAAAFVGSQEFQDHYGVGSSFDLPSFVTSLYHHVLDRDPDDAGLKAWIDSGLSPAELLIGFAQSAEFIGRAAPETLEFLLRGALGTEDHRGSIFTDIPAPAGQSDGVTDLAASLERLYHVILQRDPGPAELAWRAEQLSHGGFSFQEVSDIVGASGEASGHPATVIRLYEALFGHKPDIGGFDAWTDALTAGASLHDIAAGFVATQEFKDHYGVGQSFDRATFVATLYRHVLDREPDSAGLLAWTHSGLSAADLVVSFSQSQEFIDRAAPAVLKFYNTIADGRETYLGSIFDKPVAAPGDDDAPANQAPVAVADPDYVTEQFEPYHVDASHGVLANDHDPNGDPLQAVLVDASNMNGALTLHPDGSFDYLPDPRGRFEGEDRFTYQARDSHGVLSAVTQATITVEADNHVPVAKSDAYPVAAGTSLTVAAAGVLTNDRDQDGEPLAAVLDVGPKHGTLALHADGSFVYTADSGYAGLDSFTYFATDAIDLSLAATVTLTIAPASEPAVLLMGLAPPSDPL